MTSLGAQFIADMKLKPSFSMRDAHDWCKAHGVESLSQGMIELAPPTGLRNLASSFATGEDCHTYRSRRGEPDFLNALVKTLERTYSTRVPETALLATSGVTGAIFATLQTIRRKHGAGVRVGLTNPFYTYHAKHVELATGKPPVFVQTDIAGDTFDIDFASLEEQLKNGMKGLIVCNPGNPSGRVYPKETFLKLVEATGRHDCILILDEIYADLVWRGNSFYSPVQDGLHRHVVACRGFSKNVACQSWRVGYLITHPETVQQILQEHDPIYISVPILQHALAKFLSEHPDEYEAHIKKANDAMQRNLELLSSTLSSSLGWKFLRPQGSMYAMFRHNEASDVEAVAKVNFEGIDKGVGVAAGSMFFEGTPQKSGFIRIHVGLDEERVAAICKRIAASSSK